MSDVLSIGASGVSAYQRALSTVSNNISNLATPGYTRQVTDFSAGAPQAVGNLFIGTGVNADGVKRLYDQFSEAALRTAFSNAAVQGPLVDYSNRIIDSIGNGSSSLASSLNQFFSSAQAAAGDPASLDLRNKLMTDAGGLAGRFRLLASQLDGIESDSRGQINSDLGQLNSYSSQLAAVNGQLQGVSLEAQQPAALLDQRDQLLRDMSKLCSLRIAFRADGEVSVGVAGSSQVNIVEGSHSRDVSAQFDDARSGKVDLIVDPYGSPSVIGGSPGGEIGGLVSFRQQVLEPTQASLDALAQTVVQQVNAVNANGVDLKGNVGGDLFKIDPTFSVQAPTVANPPVVTSTVVDQSKFVFHDLRLNYDAAAGGWKATDLLTGQSATGAGSIVINGTRLDIAGGGADAQTVILKAVNHPAGAISLTQSDPGGIAAAALFRAVAGASNSGATAATVTYNNTGSANAGLPGIGQVLVNNPNPLAGLQVGNTQAAWFTGIATIPAGYKNVSVYLGAPSSAGQDVQVFTRDGRQLAGTPLSNEHASKLLTAQNGFNAGSTYSTDYLNKSGVTGYRGLSVLYGARAVPGQVPVFNDSPDPANQSVTGYKNVAANLQGASISDLSGQSGSVVFSAGQVSINGNPLPPLAMPAKGYVSAQDVAQWVNSISSQSSVVASAQNVVTIRADSLALPATAASLVSINGVSISTPCSNVSQLAAALNEQSRTTHVVASAGPAGELILKNDDANAGADITIDPVPSNRLNALSGAVGRYHGQIALASSGEIDVTGSAAQGTADLAKLGLQCGAWVSGPLDEDLLVFKTGAGTSAISASYTEGSINSLAALRSEKMQVTFTDPTHYNVVDTANGSIVASRAYDPAAGIQIGARTLHLNAGPAAGDQFTVDGNQDGTGDNSNLLELVGLQDKNITPDGLTIGASYSRVVGRVGDIVSQAQSAQQALQVISQQAQKKRDDASGVNLDTEAADLIRFQQAYQAAAKAMQVASQLFDSLTQIK